jgi:hypothetical protein
LLFILSILNSSNFIAQFDLSALQAQLQEQKAYPIGQRISSPPGTFQSFSQSQQQRPASAENQHSLRFQPSPVRNLFTPTNLQQQNKLSNMPFNATASPGIILINSQ